jgi:hypothetical protein
MEKRDNRNTVVYKYGVLARCGDMPLILATGDQENHGSRLLWVKS